MSEWIACNNCYCQPGGVDVDKHFNVTNCGHIFCDECLNKAGGRKCSVCKSDCDVMDLSSETSELRPDVALYFSDPLDIQSKALEDAQKVSEFQNSHLSRQLSYHKRLSSKTKQIADEHNKIYKKKKELERTLENCLQKHEEEIKNLRRKIDCLQSENLVQKKEIIRLRKNATRIETPQFGNFRL